MSIQELIPLVLTLSLAGLVVAVGLDATFDDLLHVVGRPALLGKALLAVNVVVPIAAVVLVLVFPLVPAARVGVILMAVCPSRRWSPVRNSRSARTRPMPMAPTAPWSCSRSSSCRSLSPS